MKTRISITDSAVLGIALGILIAFAMMFGEVFLASCSTAKANTPEPSESSYSMEVSDSPVPASPYSGVKAALVEDTSTAVAALKVKEPEPEPEEQEEIWDGETRWHDTDGNYTNDTTSGGTYSETYYAEYNEMYNEDGPSRSMPGWHDGYLETYYSSNILYHANTSEWTADEEGFYKTDDGYYVVGVDINDINPETGEGYQIGDIVETGKGEAKVMDYGFGAHVHDFYTNW